MEFNSSLFLMEDGCARLAKITTFKGERNAIDVTSARRKMTLTENQNI